MTATRLRALFVAAFVTVLTVTATGVAFAYVTGSGSGSGSAATGTTKPLVVNPGTAAADLYPGGVSAVEIAVTNPNVFTVNANSLALDITRGIGGFTVDAVHAACDVSSLSFTNQTIGGVGMAIPPGGPWAYSVASSLRMDQNAPSACQGATFTVYLKVLP